MGGGCGEVAIAGSGRYVFVKCVLWVHKRTHTYTHTYIAGMCLLRVLPGYGEAVGTVSAKLQVVPKP
jgi:hypothetical protein